MYLVEFKLSPSTEYSILSRGGLLFRPEFYQKADQNSWSILKFSNQISPYLDVEGWVLVAFIYGICQKILKKYFLLQKKVMK